MTTRTPSALRKHTFAPDRDPRWRRTQPDGFGSLVVNRLHPGCTREHVAGGFVWWSGGKIVAEIEMRGARWYGWVADPEGSKS